MTNKVLNQDGEEVSLDDFKGKWVVLYFYPKDNTPGCSIEAQDFSRLRGEFEKKNAVVLGVSMDSVESHCKFIEKKDLSIMLLSDPSKELINKFKVWDKKKFMGREFMGIIRSTFLIKDGKIVKEWRGVRVKGHAEEVLGSIE